jgi:Heterokaryon incompatibility protein (HET)
MRTWISQCVKMHTKCKRVVRNKLPARLIDVSPFINSKDVKIVDSDAGESIAQYVTLSHCWGPPSKHPLTTTKSTLRERKERIKFEDLPLTFKDAVRICRDLDQKYLWIDSLCIVQDDEIDWEEQAKMMGSIYGGSLVTLAALSSSDSKQGCRIHMKEDKLKYKLKYGPGYQDFNFGSQRVRIFTDEPGRWPKIYGDNPFKDSGGYGDEPLRTRAWTLQERELSLRSIHFADTDILWECRTMRGSSEVPWQEVMHYYEEARFAPLKLHSGESLSPDGLVFQRDRWYDIIEDYSSRSLTKESDKLPALAGLAAKFRGEQAGGMYLGGIWSHHLPSALLWRTITRSLYARQPPLPRRPKQYRAPSWSWASIDGQISYNSQRIEDTDFYSEGGRSEITTIHCEFAPHFDLFIAPPDSALRVRGLIRRLKLSLEPTDNGEDSHLQLVAGDDGQKIGKFYPDIASEMQSKQYIFCLSVRAEPHISPVKFSFGESLEASAQALIMGLALLRLGISDTYKRVGLVRELKKSAFNGTKLVDLKII